MTKFYGKIGYAIQTETSQDVWTDITVEKSCHGDIVQNKSKWNQGSNINADFTISNSFSIVADSYAKQNIGNMKYILWNGVKWKITSIDIEYPRLVINIEGVYK